MNVLQQFTANSQKGAHFLTQQQQQKKAQI